MRLLVWPFAVLRRILFLVFGLPLWLPKVLLFGTQQSRERKKLIREQKKTNKLMKQQLKAQR